MQSCCCGFVRAVGTFFQDTCYHCDCPEKLWVQDVEIAGGELRRERATLKCRAFGTGVFRTISINAIVLKNCGSKTWKWLGESCVGRVEIAGGELRREGATLKCRAFGTGVFKTISINAIVLKNCGSKTWKWLGESCVGRVEIAGGELRREGATLKCRAFGTGFSGQIP